MLKNFFKDFDFKDWWIVLSLFLLIGGMFFSPFVATLSKVLILIGLIFCATLWRKEINPFKGKLISVLCIAVLFLLDIVGLIWSDEIGKGLSVCFHESSFLTVPLFIALLSPMKKKTLDTVFFLYVVCAFAGTVIGFVNYATNEYADVRKLVPGGRNIAFSIKIAFAVSCLSLYAYFVRKNLKIILPLILWFLFFLVITQMLSGLVAIVGFAVLFAFSLVLKKRSKFNFALVSLIIIAVAYSVFWIGREYKNYFTVKEPLMKNGIVLTPDGNPYSAIDDGRIENGYLLNNYFCTAEVKQEWLKRTGLDVNLKTKDTVFTYNDIIYRYLNSLGMHKDAASVRKLSEEDIENIKRGIANKVYTEKFSLRPRLYQTFLEFEDFAHGGDVSGKSLIERYAMTLSAFNIIKQHPIIGLGTGESKDALNERLKKDYPTIERAEADPHNEFVYILVCFGSLGLLAFVLAFAFPVFKFKLWKNPYFLAFLCINLCYMLVESSLKMMAGRVFYVIFFSILVFNNQNIKKFYSSPVSE
ncbi:MAG: O-antigen ligase family protein [Bacteroidales bacterium]|nr:O-antigen ligase family protein [Bacteroidales bacterium]